MEKRVLLLSLIALCAHSLNGMHSNHTSIDLSEKTKELMLIELKDYYPVTKSPAYINLEKNYSDLEQGFFNKIKNIDISEVPLSERAIEDIKSTYKNNPVAQYYSVLQNNCFKDAPLMNLIKNETLNQNRKMEFFWAFRKLYINTINFLQQRLDGHNNNN